MTTGTLNVVLFLIYCALALLDRSGVPHASVALAAAAVLVVWVLPSLNVVLLVNKLLAKPLAAAEILVTTLCAALILIPGILAAEFLVLRQVFPWLPFANSLVIAATMWFSRPLVINWPRYSILSRVRHVASSPLTWAIMLHLTVTFALTHAFQALPDIDPYKWANWYSLWLKTPYPQSVPTRSLYYFFLYLFVPGSHIPLYTFFKFVFPFIGILMVLAGYLTIPRNTSRHTQFVWLLLPFFAPSLILYTALPIPQSLLLISTVLFFHLILYATVTHQDRFYWLAGSTILGAFFYHQAAALMAALWLIGTLWWKRKELVRLILRYKTITVIVILGAAYLNQQIGFYSFIAHWLTKIIPLIRFKPNWHFPAYYVSIDGQSVGWAGLVGVSKYYLFYVGPPLIGIALLGAIVWVTSARFRHSVKELFSPKSPLFVLSLCGILFVTIAEILPRVSSIALLPERAWLFGGIFSGLALWKLLLLPRLRISLEIALLGLVALSIGGALYVNHTKAHVIPDYQVRAAEWIKMNLPTNRVIISNEQPYLLTTNAESTILPIDGISLCNLDLTEDEFLANAWARFNPQLSKERQQIREVYFQRLQALIETDRHITLADLEATSEHFINKLNENAQATMNVPEFKRRIFIYHAAPDNQNVLLTRPYVQANEEVVCLNPVFDQFPQYFTKIYDDQGLVRLWRFTDPN